MNSKTNNLSNDDVFYKELDTKKNILYKIKKETVNYKKFKKNYKMKHFKGNYFSKC